LRLKGRFEFEQNDKKKQVAIKDADKQIFRKHKEYKRLCSQYRELPMIDLNPPIQRGWKRYFVLRDDVRRSKEGVFYENLLMRINTLQYNPTKDFKTRKIKKGKKVSEDKEQHLRRFYPYELPKLKLTEKEMMCFTLKTKVVVKNKKIVVTSFYEFNEPWRYVLRVRPNLITQMQVFDADLNQRIDELRDELWGNPVCRGRYEKLKGRRKWKNIKGEFEKNRNPIQNIPLRDVIEGDF
jgi:hypothetical protein